MLQKEIIYFIMAKEFSYNRTQVDKLDYDTVIQMMWLEDKYRKIQAQTKK